MDDILICRIKGIVKLFLGGGRELGKIYSMEIGGEL
jgi:hypothetical protein